MAPLGAETRRCATYNRSLLNVDCLAITDVAKPRDCVQFDGIRYGLNLAVASYKHRYPRVRSAERPASSCPVNSVGV
jgi:hypothetical protein